MLKRNRAAIVLAVAFVIAAMLAPKAQADAGIRGATAAAENHSTRATNNASDQGDTDEHSS
ncbi:MAG: hypothetical protein AAGF46_10295 [Pseudomonadota bacterium]